MFDFVHRTHSKQTRRISSRIRIWSRILVLTGLGTMILTGLCLLSGCGSDSTPGGSVKGKNSKAATLGAKKTAGAISLLGVKEDINSGQIKPQPESRRIEVFSGMNMEELKAKVAADQKRVDSMDMEVMPGITKKELEAKIATDCEKFLSKPQEILPGITQEELKAKIAADCEKFLSKPQEIVPGITLAELQARLSAEKSPDPRLMMQTFPGVNHK